MIIAQNAIRVRCDIRIFRLQVTCEYRNIIGMSNAATNVIRKCGGPQAVSAMAGVNVSNVHRWTYPKERGGTGGVVPAKHQHTLLKKAREAGIELSPDDFFEEAEEDLPRRPRKQPHIHHGAAA